MGSQNPTDYVNLSDWLGLNADQGQQMDAALGQDVQDRADSSRQHLNAATNDALIMNQYGGSSDLTSYGDYVTGQREAIEAQQRAAAYKTQAGRQAGLREKYGDANALDAALTTGGATPDVSGLDSEYSDRAKTVADFGTEQWNRRENERQHQTAAYQQFNQNNKDREAAYKERLRRKAVVDSWKQAILNKYHYENQKMMEKPGGHPYDPSLAPENWSDDQWYREAQSYEDAANGLAVKRPNVNGAGVGGEF